MSKIHICLDPGSTHNADLDRCKELIDLAKEVGADSIKFQLFLNLKSRGCTPTHDVVEKNIELPRKYWSDIQKHAREKDIEVFASAFDKEAVDILRINTSNKIKLSYDKAFDLELVNYIRQFDFEIIASGDNANYCDYPSILLFRPEGYPVRSKYELDNFDARDYDGISSHTLGYKSDIYLLKKFKKTDIETIYCEKHFMLGNPCGVPDESFALSPKNLREWVKKIRGLEC